MERIPAAEEVLQFDKVMERVKIKFDTQKREEYLLFERGRFNIRSGKKEWIKFEKQVPLNSAVFQANERMYVCGGRNDRMKE